MGGAAADASAAACRLAHAAAASLSYSSGGAVVGVGGRRPRLSSVSVVGETINEVSCSVHAGTCHLVVAAVCNVDDLGGVGGHAVLLDRRSGRTRVLPGTGASVTEADFTADGAHVVAGASDGAVTVYAAHGQRQWAFDSFERDVVALAVRPQPGAVFAAAGHRARHVYCINAATQVAETLLRRRIRLSMYR